MAEITNDQAVLLERALQANKKVIAENKTVTADCHVKSRKSKARSKRRSTHVPNQTQYGSTLE